MFGYIKIEKDELKFREFRVYQAFYCGLCRVLQQDYGIGAKLLLNYDCTFAAILLCYAFEGGVYTMQTHRCTIYPLRKKPMVERTPAIEFAAALNVLLAYYSMEDGWQDEKSVLKGAGRAVYRNAAKKAIAKYPDMARAVVSGLEKLHEVETKKEKDLDMAANASAEILSGAAMAFPTSDSGNMKLVAVLCRSLGRWIYIADAWNDREHDAKKDSYNPFLLTGADVERARNVLYMSLSDATDALELLEWDAEQPLAVILRNILVLGCSGVIERVLTGKEKSKKHRVDRK